MSNALHSLHFHQAALLSLFYVVGHSSEDTCPSTYDTLLYSQYLSHLVSVSYLHTSLLFFSFSPPLSSSLSLYFYCHHSLCRSCISSPHASSLTYCFASQFLSNTVTTKWVIALSKAMAIQTQLSLKEQFIGSISMDSHGGLDALSIRVIAISPPTKLLKSLPTKSSFCFLMTTTAFAFMTNPKQSPFARTMNISIGSQNIVGSTGWA